jgi:hypothetical protein
MRGLLLLLLCLLGILGVGITLWASGGDASVMAGTAGIHSALEAHGLGDNAALRDDLYGAVLRLRRPWAVVHWMGLAVLGLAAAGFAVVWRNRRS